MESFTAWKKCIFVGDVNCGFTQNEKMASKPRKSPDPEKKSPIKFGVFLAHENPFFFEPLNRGNRQILRFWTLTFFGSLKIRVVKSPNRKTTFWSKRRPRKFIDNSVTKDCGKNHHFGGPKKVKITGGESQLNFD